MQRGPMGVVRASPRRHDFGIQTLGAWHSCIKLLLPFACRRDPRLPYTSCLRTCLHVRSFLGLVSLRFLTYI